MPRSGCWVLHGVNPSKKNYKTCWMKIWKLPPLNTLWMPNSPSILSLCNSAIKTYFIFVNSLGMRQMPLNFTCRRALVSAVKVNFRSFVDRKYKSICLNMMVMSCRYADLSSEGSNNGFIFLSLSVILSSCDFIWRTNSKNFAVPIMFCCTSTALVFLWKLFSVREAFCFSKFLVYNVAKLRGVFLTIPLDSFSWIFIKSSQLVIYYFCLKKESIWVFSVHKLLQTLNEMYRILE